MLAAVIKTRGNVVQIFKKRGLNMEIKQFQRAAGISEAWPLAGSRISLLR